MNKAIDNMYECKSDIQVCEELAKRLGIEGYSDKTEDEWLRDLYQTAGDLDPKNPLVDYDELKKKGVHKIQLDGPAIAFKEQVQDPENNPFPTESGKIEIYSEKMQQMKHPKLPPIPKYIETWESLNDPLAKKYPLQLITTHNTRRVNANWDNIPWLRECEPPEVWISSADAESRGINHGDTVRIFNQRGEVALPAKVTERMMPGVINIAEGGWFKPDKKGVDRGGCCNVLLKDEHSPAGAFCSNTCLVQVNKENEGQ
jgi:anaerobic dimethyl sulfoxide reductase subunit A